MLPENLFQFYILKVLLQTLRFIFFCLAKETARESLELEGDELDEVILHHLFTYENDAGIQGVFIQGCSALI